MVSDTDKVHLENTEQPWADWRLPRGGRGSREEPGGSTGQGGPLVQPGGREARRHLRREKRDNADDQGPEDWSEESGEVAGGDLKLQPLSWNKEGWRRWPRAPVEMWTQPCVGQARGQSINRTMVKSCWEVLPHPPCS